jgi:hypothetical protein
MRGEGFNPMTLMVGSKLLYSFLERRRRVLLSLSENYTCRLSQKRLSPCLSPRSRLPLKWERRSFVDLPMLPLEDHGSVTVIENRALLIPAVCVDAENI